MPRGQPADTLPDWQVTKILADGITHHVLADGAAGPNTTRAMGLVPVNAPQATSVVGHSPDYDSEFVVTHISNRLDKTSGGR